MRRKRNMTNPLEFVANAHMEALYDRANESLPDHVEFLSLLTLPSVPFEQRRGLPDSPAIYFVMNARRFLLYVGQTNNLARRWYRHQHLALLRECQAAYLAWLVPHDFALLPAIEAVFIAGFRPPCNSYIAGAGALRSARIAFVQAELDRLYMEES